MSKSNLTFMLKNWGPEKSLYTHVGRPCFVANTPLLFHISNLRFITYINYQKYLPRKWMPKNTMSLKNKLNLKRKKACVFRAKNHEFFHYIVIESGELHECWIIDTFFLKHCDLIALGDSLVLFSSDQRI